MKTSKIGESRLLHVLLSVAVVLALLVVDSGAAELTITNQSFENPVLPDGGANFSVPGWTGQGTVQIYNPNNSFFSGTTDGSSGSPLDGLNAASVNVGGKLSYQSTYLVSSQVVYSLTFLAGYRIGVPFGAGSVSFWAGTNLLAEQFPTPTEGTFMPFSLTYTSPPSGPGIGIPLRIELKAVGTDSQPWFDSFHLFADTAVETATSNAPSILVQPESKSVIVGANAALSVQVSGTAPLAYQWQFNSAAIEGANAAALALTNVQISQSGNYSVVVSNAFGLVVSSNALLTVNQPPPGADFDISRDFSVTANPNGSWSYGHKTALNGSFGLNLTRQTGIANGGVPLELWGFQPNTLPAVYFNASTNTAITEGGQGNYPPGTVFFLAGHDGTEQNFGAIRLTVPAGADGEYQLESAVRTYLSGPISGDTDYHVVKNGVELFGQFMPGSSRSGYSNVVSLASGDILDFMVGRGQDGQLYGSGLNIDARLYLLGATSNAPSILVQPESKSVIVGANVALSVQVSGTAPLAYQWQFNGAAIEGAQASALSLTNVQISQSGNYSVVVSNAFGLVVSSNALLTVNQPPPGADFDLSRDFSLTANPNGSWSYGHKTALNGSFGLNLTRQTGIAEGGVPLDLWGFQPNTLPAVYFNASTNTAITHGGQGNYPPGTVFFLAGHDGTEQNFGAIRLTVPAGADGEYQLESAVRTYLSGPISGDTDYHVVKNGVELFGQFMPGSSRSGYSNVVSLVSGDILDFMVGRGQDGQLYGSGLIIDARLYLLTATSNAPSILVQPESKSVIVGANAALSVQVSGTAPLAYQWQFNSAAIEGANAAALALTNVQISQSGNYSVVVSNAFGLVVSSNALLTVNQPPPGADFDISRDFSVTANPNGSWSYGHKTALNGSFGLNLTRQTGIANGGVPLELWGFQPNTLPAVYFNASTNTAITEGGQGNYPPGTVFFLAGHDGTEQNFGAIRLTVPAGADGEYQLESAVRTYLSGPISGDTDYHVVKNGVELFGQFMPGSSRSGYSNVVSLASGDILDFMVGRGQDGQLYGSGLNIDARLYLLGATSNAPSILVQPESKSVIVGANVALSVQVSGTAPLAYQWQFNGAAIEGAQASALSLTNVQISQSGNYSVVVSNAFGLVVSSNALLTVNQPPPGADFDLSRDFSLTANPNGSWSYGHKTALNGSFGLNLTRQTGIAEGGVPLDLWGFQPNTLPAVYFNASTNTAITHGGQGNYPPGTVFFLAGHDGTEQNFGAIRLTVPAGADGEYQLESAVRTYLSGPISGDTDYHVVKNGVELFGQFMPGSSRSGYSNVVSLVSGDILDFMVGRGQDGQLYGSGLIIDARLYLLTATSNAPSILVQPQGQDIVSGNSLTLSVIANGTPPLRYQWYKGVTSIGEATNSALQLSNVLTTDSGDYAVVIQNDYGSITSDVAVATVEPGPTILRVVSMTGSNAGVLVPIELVANGRENAIGFSLLFDPTILTFNGAMLGTSPELQNAVLIVNSNSAGAGRIGIAVAMPTDVTFSAGARHLIRVGFEVAPSTNGTAANIQFRDQPTTREVSDGQGNPLAAIYVSSQLSVIPTSFNGFEGDLSPRPLGNFNVTITDWVQAGRFLSGVDAITNQTEFQNMDCSPRETRGDSIITVSDWVQVGRYAAGLDPLTPVGGPTAPSENEGLRNGGSQPKGASTRSLNITSITARPGATFALPLVLAAEGNENAIAFSLAFDQTKMEFLGVTKLVKIGGAVININTNQAANGIIGIALALPAGSTIAAGTDSILLANFIARSNTSGVATVGFSGTPVTRGIADDSAHTLSASFIDGTVTLEAQPSGPSLGITQFDTTTLIYWPSTATGYELHFSTDLSVGTWTKVTAVPLILGGQKLVTLPSNGPQRFFKLVKP